MEFARHFRGELVAEAEQFRTDVCVDFFHPRAEAFDFEDLEVVRCESKFRQAFPLHG
jgi:hypothetical protein